MMFAKKLYAFYLVATAVALISTQEIAAANYNADSQVAIPQDGANVQATTDYGNNPAPNENVIDQPYEKKATTDYGKSPAPKENVIDQPYEKKGKKKHGKYGKKVDMIYPHSNEPHCSEPCVTKSRGHTKKKEYIKKPHGSKDKSKPCVTKSPGYSKKKEYNKKPHYSKSKGKKKEYTKKPHYSKYKSTPCVTQSHGNTKSSGKYLLA
jgi:hypothetical protein